MKKPNVLFLFSDQHNAKCLSCAGHESVRTENLDRLAGEGIMFNNAYTNNPICTPSRISFLSGLYPSTHGYYGLYGREPDMKMTSIIKHFKDNGYRTGALGKLHTPRYWIEKDCQFVYDEFIEYPKYLEGAGLYEMNDSRPFTECNAGRSKIPLEHSCETVLAGQTIRFIRNEGEPKDRGKEDIPWFAWVSFNRPHQPYTPSEPYASMYPPDSIKLPPVSDNPKEHIREQREKIDETELRSIMSAYYGLISQVDNGIGIILEELERQGELENTVILYTADHGEFAGEQGIYEKYGGISHRAVTQIPMIVRLPGKRYAGLDVDDIVEAIDVFPSLCEFSNVEIPNTVQGRSFADIITEGVKREDAYALTENLYRKALAYGEWRYIADLSANGEDELYNITEDPWEIKNRINEPEYADISKRLQRLLLEKVVRARKPITTIDGGWHDHIYDLDGRIDMNCRKKMNQYW